MADPSSLEWIIDPEGEDRVTVETGGRGSETIGALTRNDNGTGEMVVDQWMTAAARQIAGFGVPVGLPAGGLDRAGGRVIADQVRPRPFAPAFDAPTAARLLREAVGMIGTTADAVEWIVDPDEFVRRVFVRRVKPGCCFLTADAWESLVKTSWDRARKEAIYALPDAIEPRPAPETPGQDPYLNALPRVVSMMPGSGIWSPTLALARNPQMFESSSTWAVQSLTIKDLGLLRALRLPVEAAGWRASHQLQEGSMKPVADVLDVLAAAGAAGTWVWWPVRDNGRLVVLAMAHPRLWLDSSVRLSRFDGPAVEFRDGEGRPVPWWQGHCVAGVHLTKVDYENVDIKAEEVLALPNQEIRRAMVDLYQERHGAGSIVRDAGGRVVDESRHNGLLRRLWRLGPDPRPPSRRRIIGTPTNPLGPVGTIQYVEVENGTLEADGSRKTYWLRVPPAVLKADEAVAWTFGTDSGEYKPAVET